MKNINNNIKIFKICLLLIGIGILLSFGVNTSAAASSSGIYVNGSSGNDNWDGLNSTYTSGINGPKATITNATGTVTSSGTVHIASGTYYESNIQITTNMTIIGENQANTVIDAQTNGNIFDIATGVNLTLINITLQNGASSSGGAIINNGTLSVTNTTFNKNTATSWNVGNGGGAIYNTGTLTVNNTTFNNNVANYNGGAIYNELGTLTETNITFNNNSAKYGEGGTIYNTGTLTGTNDTFNNSAAGPGGAIYNTGTLTIHNSTFTNSNSNYHYGGAIYNNGILNVTNTTFNNNIAAYSYGGAIYNELGTLTETNDTFNNNTSGQGGAIYNTGTSTENKDTFNNNTSNSGGAIYNTGALNVNNATFNNNMGNMSGGAVFNYYGTLNVNNTLFNNNTSTNGNGGAIYSQGNFTVTNGLHYNTTTNTGLNGGAGAIQNNFGCTLIVTNSTFNNNYTKYGNGGAIYSQGNFIVTNTIFNNNSAAYGGAIYNGNTLTVNNTTFTNNTLNSNYGQGGAIYNAYTLTVNNSTFNNNTATYGGAIYNGNTLTMNNTTFTNNTATNYGGAIYNGNTLTMNNTTFTNNTATNYGGAIYSQNSLTVNNSTFTNNTATNYGGAIADFGSLNVEGSSFVNNSAVAGGAFYFDNQPSAIVNVNFNRIIGNTPNSIELYNDGMTRSINATYNWWGSNANPENEIIGTGVTYNPWIILTVKANPTTINTGDKSTVSADLLHDNEGNYLDPVNGHVPDGIPVNFSNNGLGTLNLITTTTTNESASTTMTAHSSGVSEVSTKVDNQTLTTNITINKIPSAYLYLQITSSNKNPKVGEPFTLTYKLGNNGPDSAVNVVMTIPLPSDYILSNITGDRNWTINKTTNTITWTLINVSVGDPYLYITGKINKSGVYVFGSNITSETYNLNTQGITPITITSKDPVTPINPTKPTIPNTKTTLNSETSTIPMQHTGLPIAGLILAILSVLGGSVMSRKK